MLEATGMVKCGTIYTREPYQAFFIIYNTQQALSTYEIFFFQIRFHLITRQHFPVDIYVSYLAVKLLIAMKIVNE